MTNHSNREAERLLTTRELADRLGVRTETVLRWTREGRIEAVRLSCRAFRYRLDAVLQRLGNTSREGGPTVG
jgi:excisionase family DNA binding protein